MDEDLPQQGQLPVSSKPKFNPLTNPTLMGWLTILGTVLGIYGLYQAYQSEKVAKPVYRVISDVVVTESRQNSKIKVYYDSVEVQNVRAATVVLWNAGNEYLDKSAFSRDKPISIKCSVPIRILEAKMIATTRPELKFSQTFHPDQVKGKFDQVDLQIEGDEGLEADDGATFSIIYTGKVNGNWYIDTRIKGAPKGFQKVFEPERKLEYGDIIFLVTAISISVLFYYGVRSKDSNIFDRILFFGICLLVLVMLFNTLHFGYNTATLLSPPEKLIK
ncbi:hypothetical protein EXU85_20305 [Spirosoma sp. KCTC 42546]|uniref:hypothetical protein n=1 Tax=Spirosoma sp. KCTC 42546 TaxID=2520506 RepID=UPI001158D59E|nr:hypothetical protein [Spirosoma sp. KCTC 42546]QDK80822.1 hypothetical protein EXU85_20305 [Spirosoma sp. KCTC 42546]